MMVETNRKENLKQKYNDFHNYHIFLPYEREEGKKKGKKKKRRGEKTRRERKGARQARKILFFFFPFAKRRGNSEVSANNVINKVSLYVIESHHAFHIASSTLLKLPHHWLKSCHTTWSESGIKSDNYYTELETSATFAY